MWTGVALDGISFAVIGLTLGLMVCALARSRGAAWATVGAVMTTLGGAVYAMGAYAFASLVWYATDTDVLAAADGTRLLDYAVDHPEHGQVLHMAGFLAYTLGTLAVAVALLRSSAIHRTVPDRPDRPDGRPVHADPRPGSGLPAGRPDGRAGRRSREATSARPASPRGARSPPAQPLPGRCRLEPGQEAGERVRGHRQLERPRGGAARTITWPAYKRVRLGADGLPRAS